MFGGDFLEMICKSGRVCRNGRVALYWKYMVPEKFADAAGKFEESMRSLSEKVGERPISALMIFHDEVITVSVSSGGKLLFSDSFQI